MADPELAIYRMVVISFICGIATAPGIVFFHPMFGFTIPPVLAFTRVTVARGIIVFVSKAIDDGGWAESIIHGLVAALSFFSGGAFVMFLCFLGPELWSQITGFIVIGGFSVYRSIMALEDWLREERSQGFKIGDFTLFLVISAIVVAMTGLEALCRQIFL